MPYKRKTKGNDEAVIYDLVLAVFRTTTKEERLAIAIKWCQDFGIDPKFTDPAPIYYILAALIDVEHPILISSRGRMFTLVGCIAEILTAENRQAAPAIPYQIIHSPPVYGCVEPTSYTQAIGKK